MSIIAVDFDGTIVEHAFPDIGKEIPDAIDTLKWLVEQGHRLILWTMRSDSTLQAAYEFLKERGVEMWGVNTNPDQDSWTDSPKVYAHIYIDDAALGCPLMTTPPGERVRVDWMRVRQDLEIILS